MLHHEISYSQVDDSDKLGARTEKGTKGMRSFWVGFLGIVLAVGQATAAQLFVATDQGGATGLYATVLVQEVAGDKIRITTTLVPDPTSNGDITGIFFDFVNGAPVGFDIDDDIDGDDITDRETNVSQWPSGPNVTPLGPYHIGLQIGALGGGTDVFTSTVIYILGASSFGLTETSFSEFAVRVQSVSPPASGQTSLKLVTGEPTTVPDTPGDTGDPIPEPSTWLLLGAGLGLIGLAKAKRMRRG